MKILNKKRYGQAIVKCILAILIISIITAGIVYGGPLLVNKINMNNMNEKLSNCSTGIRNMFESESYKKLDIMKNIYEYTTYNSSNEKVMAETSKTDSSNLDMLGYLNNNHFEKNNILSDGINDGMNDVWGTPYLYSYANGQVGGKEISIVIINSAGKNKTDECINGAKILFDTGIVFSSAEDAVNNMSYGDDCGIVVLNVDGSITTRSYGWVEKIIIDTPASVRISGTMVSWAPLVNAYGYDVYSNGSIIAKEIKETTYDLKNTIYETGNYQISIMAIGKNIYENSEMSECQQYVISEQLETPEIKLEKTILTWNLVPNATNYIIYNNEEILVDNITETTYDLNQIEKGGSYNISVTAKGDNLVYLESEKSETKKFIKKEQLPAPKIYIDGSIISWDEITGARGYTIYKDNVILTSNTSKNSYDLSVISKVGTYEITVVANGDNIIYENSIKSNPVTFIKMKTLDAPVVKITKNILSWTAVTNAKGYIIYKDGSIVTNVTNETSYTINITTAGTYKFTVAASGDGKEYKDSKQSIAITYTKLEELGTPVAKISNSSLSWGAIANAKGYTVYKDGTAIATNVSGTTYDLSSITTAGTYKLTVSANGDGIKYEDSKQSAAVSYVKATALTTPMLTISGTTLSWNSNVNAKDYTIYINGAAQTPNIKGTNYTINVTSPGKYKFSVVANGNGTTYSNSAKSTEVSYVKTSTLSAPVISLSGTTINWGAVTNAIKYTIYNQSNIIASNITATSYTLTNITPGQYNITVVATGDGEIYLPSSKSNAVSYVKTQTLGTTTVTINGTTLSWNPVANANSYTVYDGNVVLSSGLTTTTYSLSAITAGQHNISVVAVGDGTVYFTGGKSIAVAYTKTQKLTRPIIEANATTLSWGEIPNALSYTVYDGENVISSGTNKTSFNLDSITELGQHNITVVAIGDGTTYLNSDKSPVVNFIKTQTLSAPVITLYNKSHYNSNSGNESYYDYVIGWESVPNAVSYTIYKDGIEIETGNTSGHCDLSEKVSDIGNCNITVKAIGNNNTYLNSAISNTINYTAHAYGNWTSPIDGESLTSPTFTGTEDKEYRCVVTGTPTRYDYKTAVYDTENGTISEWTTYTNKESVPQETTTLKVETISTYTVYLYQVSERGIN